MVNANAINYFSPAKWVVSTVAGEGTHTTIAAALTSASSGDTIFIMPGTYTENITMKAGVNLSAFGSDGITPCQGSPFPVAVNVIIKGTVTATYTGQAAISGIQLRTNSATALSMTGSNACNLTFFGASIYALDGDGMTINNANAAINFYSCTCRYTTGFALFTVTATFGIDFENCTFQGTVSTSTIAAGRVVFNGCDMPGILITTSATGQVFANACYWQASGSTLLTTAGTVLSEIYNSFLLSGSASAISIGAGTTLNIANTSLSSSNTDVITGAGTVNHGNLTFVGSSSTINPSTPVLLPHSEIYVPTGITFDNSNVLSTYATTSWTPAITFGGGNTGITYSSHTGEYTRIGNIVYIWGQVTLSSKGSSSGTAAITGLPVAAIHTGDIVCINYFANFTFTALYSTLCAYTTASATTLTLSQSGSAQGAGAPTDTNFSNTSTFYFNGFYFTS